MAPLKDATFEIGYEIQLTATVNAAAEPVEAVWQKDSKPLDTKSKGVTAKCKKGKCTLKIDPCSVADDGEYAVTVKNPSGTVSSSANITILCILIWSFALIY